MTLSGSVLRAASLITSALLLSGCHLSDSRMAQGVSDGRPVDESAPSAAEGERILAERDEVADALATWQAEAQAKAHGETVPDPEDARPAHVEGEWAEGLLGPEEASLPPAFGFLVLNAWAHFDGETFFGVYAGIGAGLTGRCSSRPLTRTP